MTNALDNALTAIDSAADSVEAIDDPVECYNAARNLRTGIASCDRRLMEIQKARVWQLYEGRSWAQVGELLGISGSRAEALAKGR